MLHIGPYIIHQITALIILVAWFGLTFGNEGINHTARASLFCSSLRFYSHPPCTSVQQTRIYTGTALPPFMYTHTQKQQIGLHSSTPHRRILLLSRRVCMYPAAVRLSTSTLHSSSGGYLGVGNNSVHILGFWVLRLLCYTSKNAKTKRGTQQK